MFFNCCLFKAAGNRRYNISRRSPATESHKSSKTGILNRQKTGPEPSVSCKNGYFKRAVAQPGAMAFTILHGRLPIVFNVGGDPVKSGLVASFKRPGGNITGVSTMSPVLEAKRLGLLRELVPRAAVVAVLLNATNPDVTFQRQDLTAAAAALGQELRFFYASNETELDTALEALAQQRADALLVGNDIFFANRREHIVALVARNAVPAIYGFRQFAESGGLLSYSTNLIEVYRQIGFYVGRVLKGEKPANLPVTQPTKFELVINLKTAHALGLIVPQSL